MCLSHSHLLSLLIFLFKNPADRFQTLVKYHFMQVVNRAMTFPCVYVCVHTCVYLRVHEAKEWVNAIYQESRFLPGELIKEVLGTQT